MGDSFSISRRFVVLISGRGSNMQAIAQAIQQQQLQAQIVAVISNTPDAAGLLWAQQQGLVTRTVNHRNYASRTLFDTALGDVIAEYQPDYILLAGFMRILTPEFVARFTEQVINIHPSLLPAFAGLNTHQLALAAGVQWHGCTVHFVTPVLDHGPIISQGLVPVQANDNPDTLAARVLLLEHRMYADVVRWLSEDRVFIDEAQRVHVNGLTCRSYLLTPQGVESTESEL